MTEDTESTLTATIEESKPKSLSIAGWNLVDLGQRGAAQDASEDIVPLMEDAVGEQTLFILPKGRYLVDQEFDPDGWNRIGIVGRPHAEIVVTDDEQTFGRCFNLVNDDASKAWIENLTFDYTREGVGPQALGVSVSDRLLIRDVNVRGQCDYIDREGRPSSTVYPNISTADGTGLIENLNLPHGSAFDQELHDADRASSQFVENNWGLIGVNVYIHHKGTLRFRDCSVANFPDAGLYLKDSAGVGSSIVEGGHFWNNGASDVRLGHNDEMHGGLIEATEEKGYAGPALWLQKGEPVVRDTKIICYRWGGECVRIGSAGATLDNVTIETSIDTRTIRMTDSEDGVNKGVTMQNCDFRTYGQPQGHAVLIRRDDATFHDCRFEYVGGPENPESKNLVYTNKATDWIDCKFDTPEIGLRVASPNLDIRGCAFNESRVRIDSECAVGLLCEQNRLREDALEVAEGDRDEVADGNILS